LKLADFGLRNGINEIIAVTEGEWLNTAPIGIIVEDENSVFAKARLYPSHTRKNVEMGSRMWANVVFDPVIFVISAFEDLDEEYFASLNPPILRNAAAWCEFEATLEGSVANLRLVDGDVLNVPLRSVNRGFNALIEALVHATRYVISGSEDLKERILYYGTIIRKCGGYEEEKAFELLLKYAGLDNRED
jgi:hypothetical protein